MVSPTASGPVRTGYLLVTGILLLSAAFGLLALVSVGVGLARHGDSLLYGDTLTVPLQLSPDDVGPLPTGLRVDSWLDARVEVRDPSSDQMFYRSAVDFGPLALVIGGLWLVRGILRSVMRGDAFGPDNVRRLRRLGFLLVVGGPAVEMLNYGFHNALFSTLPSFPGVDLGTAGYTIPGGALLGGLGAFILAEVFAYGSRLREDVEATI